jgi:regulator of protease activity HflC (stomatin/prohibitin superfamily)
LTYGFRRQAISEDEDRPRVIDWTSPHQNSGEQPIPDESLLLTADEVPVELSAEVQYRVSNLEEFLFGNAEPEASLRALAGQTFRALAAETTLDEMLTVGRRRLEEQAKSRLRQRANQLKLGLEISAVHLIEVHPPQGVVPAYRDVANAWEEKEQRINEAQAARISRLMEIAGPRALAELKNRHHLDWESAKEGSAELSEEAWTALAETQPGDDGSELKHLAGQAADVLLEAAGSAVTTRENAQGEADRFRELQPIYRAEPELTFTELYWKTIEAVLGRQPFTILDPKAVGRRHLFLGNSDWREFTPIPPVIDGPATEDAGDRKPD